jgi:hypothetical protein
MNQDHEAELLFKKLSPSFPSLCIPRMLINIDDINIDEKYIANIFNKLNIGEIHKVDIMNKTNGKGDEKTKRVFVHFKRWFNNDIANQTRDRLLNGKEIKIIYGGPWFWKASAFRELKDKKPY